MASIDVTCPYCKGHKVIKKGDTAQGVQRYHCRHTACQRTFLLDYQNNGCQPGMAERIIDMGMNGSGVRDTARVLGISINTVLSAFKKRGPNCSR